MFGNATISSRSSSSCSRNSSMPSIHMRNPLSPKTSYNPLYRHSDQLTSFDASHFIFQEQKRVREKRNNGNGSSNRHSAVLRRYHSHDSSNLSATNFDCIDTNPIDSIIGKEAITPESTKSRSASEKNLSYTTSSSGGGSEKKVHEYEARDFLERYSLPRVVRVGDGEPLLLYRCFDSFTKIQARGVWGKKGKEKGDKQILHFPEGYSGWFSLTNEKGEKCATVHTSILQLVREQVCSFVSMQPFMAYAAQISDSAGTGGKVQYLKTQAKAGQLFQLRAVFQHKDRPDGNLNSTRSSRISRSVRDKDLANRYAQLVGQNNQELYVPLSVKGEFYEIHSSMKARLCFPGMLDKTGPLALDKDCLYKITHLLRRVALPVKVKLISGPLPPGLPKDFTDTFVLETKFQEPLMVTCTLPPPNQDQIQHQISCINLNSNVKLSKSTLGFDSENRLFKSQRLHAALAFCHKNVEAWYREVRLAPDFKNIETTLLQSGVPKCKICDTSYNCQCPNSNHNNEDEMEEEIEMSRPQVQQIITKEVLEKFPKPKKWYKHFKLLSKSDSQNCQYEQCNKDPMDGMEKEKYGIDRYKDMSKLIEEKFGRRSYNPVKKSASFMFSSKRVDLEESNQHRVSAALLKCQSLDTQLYSLDETNTRNSKTNLSDNISYDFQMCILDDQEDHRCSHPEPEKKMKKTKPDLIPTLPKEQDHSYITERLCNEFHVKTKVQKRSIINNNSSSSGNSKIDLPNTKKYFDPQESCDNNFNNKNKSKIQVQIHNIVNVEYMDDIPYSHVADEAPRNGTETENIYAEIVEDQSSTSCNCDNNQHINNSSKNKMLCECVNNKTNNNRTTSGKAEYCYVKLGSNGDSVIQSDSDEAIYNTLR